MSKSGDAAQLSVRQVEERFSATVDALLKPPSQKNDQKAAKPKKRVSPGRGATPSR